MYGFLYKIFPPTIFLIYFMASDSNCRHLYKIEGTIMHRYANFLVSILRMPRPLPYNFQCFA